MWTGTPAVEGCPQPTLRHVNIVRVCGGLGFRVWGSKFRQGLKVLGIGGSGVQKALEPKITLLLNLALERAARASPFVEKTLD